MKPCVLCGGEKFEAVFEAADFDTGRETFAVARCRDCGLARTQPVLDEQALQAYYQRDYYGGEAKFNPVFEKMLNLANEHRAAQILRAIQSGNNEGRAPRVLDVGCGRGGFLKALAQRGAHGWGTELPGFKFSAAPPNVHWMHGELHELNFDDGFFDAVSMWHVLEHMTDPDRAIAEAARVLRRGGVLLLAVPNFQSLQRRVFNRHWFHLDLPRHQYHFSRRTLRALLSKHGFRIEARHTSSPEQNLYGFVQSALNAASRGQPNALYFWLKASERSGRPAVPASHLAGAALIAPATALETAFSALAGWGATLIVLTRKTESVCAGD